MNRFLACDWGTTNLRAWVLAEDGAIEARQDFTFGVAKLAPGEAQQKFEREVRLAVGAQDLPALLCGMIGSALGWTVVPYVECPADAASLAQDLFQADSMARIVPGLRGPGLDGGVDVMRGEETQLIGWLALDPARQTGRHLICHPGTHAKWALVEDGRIVRFLTAMTGELFDVLTRHGVLKSDAPPKDEAAFLDGVRAAHEGDALSTRLFTTRARVVGGHMPAEASTSYLSGLLIGAEIASVPRLLDAAPGAALAVVGEPNLCRWYKLALEHGGWSATFHDGDEAVIAGLRALNNGGVL